MARVDAKYLEKVIKSMQKLLKDIEHGKYHKYGLKNMEEAEAYAEYIKSKIEQYYKILERISGKSR